MGEERFFSRANVNRAVWAAIVAICGFIGGIAYHTIFGARTVVLDQSATQHAPLVVTLKEPVAVKDGATADDIRRLARSIQALEKASKGNNAAQIESLSAEVKRLRDALARSAEPIDRTPLAAATDTSRPTSAAPKKSESPSFSLPPNTKGYTRAALVGTRDATCPPRTVPTDALLAASFRLMDATLKSRATPLIISVSRIESPSEFTEVFEATQPLNDGTNAVEVRLKLKPGKYELSYGYYLRNELGVEYPKLYARDCIFSIA